MAVNAQNLYVTLTGDADDIDLAEVISFSVDGATMDVVEITPRSKLVRSKEFFASDIDPGTLSITALYKPIAAIDVGKVVQVIMSRGATQFFYCDHAIVQSFAMSGSVGELMQFGIGLKLSGNVTF